MNLCRGDAVLWHLPACSMKNITVVKHATAAGGERLSEEAEGRKKHGGKQIQ